MSLLKQTTWKHVLVLIVMPLVLITLFCVSRLQTNNDQIEEILNVEANLLFKTLNGREVESRKYSELSISRRKRESKYGRFRYPVDDDTNTDLLVSHFKRYLHKTDKKSSRKRQSHHKVPERRRKMKPYKRGRKTHRRKIRPKPRTLPMTIEMKRNFVKQMMLHAWDGYVKYAWGHNEVKPVSLRPHRETVFGRSKIGVTIVDAMDTLFIMGLKEEFEKGREWIAEHLSFDNVNDRISLFETNIRYVGGLLSCYALTNDSMFLMKAEHIATTLLPAFRRENGFPNSHIYPATQQPESEMTNLAEIGTFHLEFIYLSDLINNQMFKEKAFQIRNILQKMKTVEGLYPISYNVNDPFDVRDHRVSLGAEGDSFYEYLLKAWIQSGKQDEDAKTMYFNAMEGVEKKLLKHSKSGLLYLPHADINYSDILYTHNRMEHLTCFAGGMFALGAHELNGESKERHMNIGAQLTKTCYESYDRSETKLGPEVMLFDEDEDATAKTFGDNRYLLRPEVVESYFYLWRLTRDVKYRDWAWQATMALERKCKAAGGYSGIQNVYEMNSAKDDIQQSFFLAETLKYLYLTFADDLLPLEQWVFNTEAHPLPIFGKNPAYPNVSTPKPKVMHRDLPMDFDDELSEEYDISYDFDPSAPRYGDKDDYEYVFEDEESEYLSELPETFVIERT